MGTPRATLTAGNLIAFGLSMAAVASTWTLYRSYLAFDTPITSTLTIANTVATVNAITSIAFTWHRYSSHRRASQQANRRATTELCERAVKIHRALDANDTAGTDFRHSLVGELIGIRAALCILHGWDPQRDADKEGPADELVIAYWERTYPAEWEEPS